VVVLVAVVAAGVVSLLVAVVPMLIAVMPVRVLGLSRLSGRDVVSVAEG
jgi:hypothetical protein